MRANVHVFDLTHSKSQVLGFYITQMDRAALRQEGVRYLLEVVSQDSLLPSVQYAALCGWLGLTSSGPR